MAAPVPSLTFNNGHKFPAVGLGCWMGGPGGGEEAEVMVRTALKLGYRHFDTAFGYGNEEHVGKAIRESGIPREEIFLTTKLTNSHHGTVAAGFEQSIKNLDIGYIDLYLMHWPQGQDAKGRVVPPDEAPSFVDTYKEMEKLLDTGKVRSIGVSNFSIKNLEILLPQIKVVPVTSPINNFSRRKVECHPYHPQPKLIEYCKEKGITITAYGPLGGWGGKGVTLLGDPEIVAIAEKNKITPAQVCISWAVQRGTVPVPKSANPERLKQNIAIVTLPKEDFDVIENLHKQPGKHVSLDPATNTKPGEVFGWTYEQMGWAIGEGGVILDD